MLDAVAAAAEEVAGTTGVATGFADVLCHVLQVNGLDELAGTRRVFYRLVSWMTSHAGCFLVSAGGVVTHQAIHVLLLGEVEGIILPSVPYVAGITEWLVGHFRDAEVVDEMFFAEQLTVRRVFIFPSPVRGLLDLFGRLGVAFQAGLGDIGTGLETLLQFLELAMVGGAGAGCGGRRATDGKNSKRYEPTDEYCCGVPVGEMLFHEVSLVLAVKTETLSER